MIFDHDMLGAVLKSDAETQRGEVSYSAGGAGLKDGHKGCGSSASIRLLFVIACSRVAGR